MKRPYCLIFVLFLLFALFSCGRDDESTTPTIPANTSPVIKAQVFTAAETIVDTETIGTVKATDADTNDILIFSIVENSKKLFEITKAGVLSLALGKSLDFETSTKHTISVAVSDGHDSNTATITITVLDVNDSLALDPTSFVTTWTILSDNFELIIGTNSELDYDFTIDWGDGVVEDLSSLTGNPSHTYETTGTYTVAINGGFPAIQMYQKDADELIPSQQALTGIEQWGAIAWESFNNAFARCINLSTYNAEDVPDLSNVQDLFSMFSRATLFNGAIGEWDTSNVTNMDSMFFKASSFNADIGNWDTSAVIKMSSMFSGASNFNQYIGDWNTSHVNSMAYMFVDTDSFDQDISTKANGTSWDTSSVMYMSGMFSGAISFNQDIGNWNTSKVKSMNRMFHGAENFDQNIEDWDTSNVTGMALMFRGAPKFNQNLGEWNVSNVTDMQNMFDNATAFNKDISQWNVSNVKYMIEMFANATSFDQDIGDWNTSKVTNMLLMFSGATKFNQDLSAWDVSSVKFMASMFENANSFDQNLGSWNLINIMDMENMLDGSAVSKANYDNALIGWEANANIPDNISLGANGLTYCNGETARDALINAKGWTISGDVFNCN